MTLNYNILIEADKRTEIFRQAYEDSKYQVENLLKTNKLAVIQNFIIKYSRPDFELLAPYILIQYLIPHVGNVRMSIDYTCKLELEGRTFTFDDIESLYNFIVRYDNLRVFL